MIQLDIEDIGLIDATPSTICAAIASEFTGESHWWSPALVVKPRSGESPALVGNEIDIRAHTTPPARFSARLVEFSERGFRLEYIGGDFRGDALCTLEPHGQQTRVCFRWRVTPAGWMAVLARLMPGQFKEAAGHHAVMATGFTQLNRYIHTPQPVAA